VVVNIPPDGRHHVIQIVPSSSTYRFLHTGPIFPSVSSLSEPGLNLFPNASSLDEKETPKPISVSDVPPEIKDAQLRADIRATGRMLGQVIQDYEGQGSFFKSVCARVCAF